MIAQRLACALALVLLPAAAGAADLPLYPIEANCREATSFLYAGSSLPAERKRALVQDCIELQRNAFENVRRLWPMLERRDQASCTELVQTENYLLLQNCAFSQYAQERNAAAVERSGKP